MSTGTEARSLAVGLSSCPNDTFLFHGLLTGRVLVPGLQFVTVMEDVETLNQRALVGAALEVSKLSASALFCLGDRYVALDCGAALGRGCGPLVVRSSQHPELEDLRALAGLRVAIPGEHTTAHLLLRLFAPRVEPVMMRFDEIVAAVARGDVDAGVIIHESRFTYSAHGLELVVDLGALWEVDTGLPLPLGIIAARRDLGAATIESVRAGLRQSVELAFARPELAWPWIRAHAQEMDETVCRRHVELYVNEFSLDLGEVGRAALAALLARARAHGLAPPDLRSPLE